jgi:hypothetical protein
MFLRTSDHTLAFLPKGAPEGPRQISQSLEIGAGDESRTRDLQLGKLHLTIRAAVFQRWHDQRCNAMRRKELWSRSVSRAI